MLHEPLPTSNPLIRKLQNFTRLSGHDRASLDAAILKKTRHFGAREDIVHEGDVPKHLEVFLSGWGCRYKVLEDGRRQVLSFLLPGDICDHNILLLQQMDHSICSITPVTVAGLSQAAVEDITHQHPRIERALSWETLVHIAMQREWTVNLGRRDAFERIGHLFCELFIRLRSLGLTHGDTCEIPLTQADIADAAGLSVVHVNRSLQELRAAKLIILKGRMLTIPEFKNLQRVSLFDPGYLHLNREGSRNDANEA